MILHLSREGIAENGRALPLVWRTHCSHASGVAGVMLANVALLVPTGLNNLFELPAANGAALMFSRFNVQQYVMLLAG